MRGQPESDQIIDTQAWRWRQDASEIQGDNDASDPKPIAPSLLAEPEHQPSGSNYAFASDIAYIRTQEGWLYSAEVMDLYVLAICQSGKRTQDEGGLGAGTHWRWPGFASIQR